MKKATQRFQPSSAASFLYTCGRSSEKKAWGAPGYRTNSTSEFVSFTSVGESACADSWGKALKSGEPALTIPCYAERRYGGVADDELLMAIPPCFLPGVIEGLAALSRNGLRYPVPPYGIQSDAGAGLAVSYQDKSKAS